MVKSVAPEVDYPHLPGEEHDPLMESTLHAAWVHTLIGAIRHTVREVSPTSWVTGNVPFVPIPGEVHTAPDLMVIPNCPGPIYTRYEVGVHGPPPTACIEVLSSSNTIAAIDRRVGRWLACGVEEVYILDPETQTIERAVLHDGQVQRLDAAGHRSASMNVTFSVTTDGLKLCCPGGRMVGIDSDSYDWLNEERARADHEAERARVASTRAREETARADAQAARVAELQREIDELRRRIDGG